MQCWVDGKAAALLKKAINDNLSAPDQISHTIISYLCHNEFYFGLKCSLSMTSGRIIFNFYDINARLCYKLSARISNLRGFQTKSIKADNNNTDLAFVGNRDSYKMVKKSLFILQYRHICFLMRWEEKNLVTFVEYFELNSSKLHCQTLITMNDECTFVPLREHATSHSPKYIEIKFKNQDAEPKIIYHLFDTNQHQMSNAHTLSSRDHSFPILFVSKQKMMKVFANNYFFQSLIQRTSRNCDFYVIDLNVYDTSPGVEYIGKFMSFYLNIAGMNKMSGQMEQIGKIWINTEHRGGFKHSMRAIEIIDDKFLIIYKDVPANKVFISYFIISNQSSHQNDIFYILDCTQKTEIKCGNMMMGNIQITKECDSDLRMFRFKMRTRNSVIKYTMNEALQVLNVVKMDNTGIDYHRFWHGEMFCDYCIKIEKDLILMKENDMKLKKETNRNHIKSLAIDGSIIAGSLAAFGAWYWVMNTIKDVKF